MVRARCFRRSGGFESIKHEMLDDVALARLFKRNGHRVGFHAAPELLRVRLYKGNRHAFWGMTKNILEGLGGRLWLAPAVMLLPVFVFWTPIFCAVAGVRTARPGLVLLAIGTYAHPVCDDLGGPKAFPLSSRQGLAVPAGRDSRDLLHGAGPLSLFTRRARSTGAAARSGSALPALMKDQG